MKDIKYIGFKFENEQIEMKTTGVNRCVFSFKRINQFTDESDEKEEMNFDDLVRVVNEYRTGFS